MGDTQLKLPICPRCGAELESTEVIEDREPVSYSYWVWACLTCGWSELLTNPGDEWIPALDLPPAPPPAGECGTR